MLTLCAFLGIFQLLSAQIYPLRPKLSDAMVLIPNPQSYVKFDANQPLFELQTAWVAISPTTCDKAWRTAPYDQFQITIE